MTSTSRLLLLAKTRTRVADGSAKALRQRYGLSLTEIAEGLSISPTTVWRYERGDRVPRGDVAVRYGQLLSDLAALEVTP